MCEDSLIEIFKQLRFDPVGSVLHISSADYYSVNVGNILTTRNFFVTYFRFRADVNMSSHTC